MKTIFEKITVFFNGWCWHLLNGVLFNCWFQRLKTEIVNTQCAQTVFIRFYTNVNL